MYGYCTIKPWGNACRTCSYRLSSRAYLAKKKNGGFQKVTEGNSIILLHFRKFSFIFFFRIFIRKRKGGCGRVCIAHTDTHGAITSRQRRHPWGWMPRVFTQKGYHNTCIYAASLNLFFARPTNALSDWDAYMYECVHMRSIQCHSVCGRNGFVKNTKRRFLEPQFISTT